MNQRIPELQELGEQFELAARELAEARRAQHPSPTSERFGRRRSWATIGLSATTLTGAAAAVIVLLSSATAPAYAGWTPDPAVPTPAELAAATASCKHSFNGPAVMTGTPVLTDQRGRFTAALFTVGTKVYDCISDGTHTLGGMNDALASLYARPGADQLELPDNSGGSLQGFMGGSPGQMPAQWRAELDSPRVRHNPRLRARLNSTFDSELSSGMERNAFGLAGSDVSAVSFAFADGTTVAATIQNGWYFAWWPSMNYPTTVTATMTNGTVTTSPMMPTGGEGPGCQFGAPGCVWAGLLPRPGSPTPTSTQTATGTTAQPTPTTTTSTIDTSANP